MNQLEMPFVGPTRKPTYQPDSVIRALPTFCASLRLAVMLSGWTQAQIAKALHIDAGEFCRMLKEQDRRHREFPHDKLSDLCAICGTLAPLQWLAMRSDTEVVPVRPIERAAA